MSMEQYEYIDKVQPFLSAWNGHGKFAMDLVERFNPGVIVDLGVDFGFSTFCFAYHKIGRVYGIDWFKGDEHAGSRDTYKIVQRIYSDIKEMMGIDNIQFIKSDFNEAAKTWDKEINILHIDGFHSYEAVSNDYNNWIKFCNPKSIILFHDVESFPETVGKFFFELNGYKLIKSGSNGLGILTQSQRVYDIIKNML